MAKYFRFVSLNRYLLGFGFFSVFWGNYGHSFFIAWFGDSIQKSLSLSAAEYGSAFFFANIASAASIVWAGSLIDKVSLKKYCVGLAVGLCCAASILAFSWNFVSLCVGLFLLRLFGQALLPHAGITTMSRQFNLNRGKAISIAGSGVPVGEIILPLIAVFLISHFGWRTAFIVIAITSIVFFIPLSHFLLIKSACAIRTQEESVAKNVGKTSSAENDATVMTMLLDRRFWLTVPGMSLPAFIVTGIFIHQAFVLDGKQWNTVWFASCFVAYGASHWISSLLTGFCVDKFSALKLLPVYLLPLIFAQLALAYADGAWVALFVMIFLGITMGANQPVSSAVWAEVYGTQNIGSIRSINVSLRVLIGSLSPVMFGIAIDDGWALRELFSLSTAYCVLANVMLSFAYSYRNATASEAE